MKNKIAFALVMGIVTTGIISFTLISVNIGYTGNFLKIWLRSWGMAYVVVIPAILIIGPRIQNWIDKLLNQKNKMNTPDFTTTITVEQSAGQAFDAINSPRAWWSEEIEGSTNALNDEFAYHYEDVHRCNIKITELVPGKKVVWHVLDNYFKFTQDKNEWKGTSISFDISENNNTTEVRFTHHGLVPAYECYEVCRGAWTTYIQNSLRELIATGKGRPNGKDKPQTENEKKLYRK